MIISHGAGFGTALMILHAAKYLDPTMAFSIAVFVFVEGAKTAPDQVKMP